LSEKIALIDNYDSFTWNLVHLAEKVSDCTVDVFLNDKVSLETLAAYKKIILSPGPGLPKDAGITPLAIKHFHASHRILGVCLGMQAIGEFFNTPLRNLDTVMHGIATPVFHLNNSKLFKGVPSPFNAGRYHSWVLNRENLDPSLEVIAVDDQKEIMAVQHRQYDLCGVQFHPESILSEHGDIIMKNWINP
jgi:anthranilate synthase component II